MKAYWTGKVNGLFVSELTHDWHEVKNDLDELSIVTPVGETVSLPRSMKYVQGKTASADLGSGEV